MEAVLIKCNPPTEAFHGEPYTNLKLIFLLTQILSILCNYDSLNILPTPITIKDNITANSKDKASKKFIFAKNIQSKEAVKHIVLRNYENNRKPDAIKSRDI